MSTLTIYLTAATGELANLRCFGSLWLDDFAETGKLATTSAGCGLAGILFAPLLAVVMVPLDFGGSAVLIFASMKELLRAGVAGVGLVMAGADTMRQIAESEAAWQQ